MRKRPVFAGLAVAAVAIGSVAFGGAAAWATPSGGSAADNVWMHGGSNMGECSAYLAQLDVPGVGNVRAEVNHVIKEYGSYLGLSSPGDLYSVRAKQAVNLAPVDECQPRQLPGGGTG
jgi:hypothetical protein